MKIVKRDDYKVVMLTDGKAISDAVKLINKGKADGINFLFVENFPSNIDEIKHATATKLVQINDYAGDFDYSAINSFSQLEDLLVNNLSVYL